MAVPLNTQVTDAGLKHLRGLTQLRTLSSANTQVTDAGLEHLRGLTQLQWLFLVNTQVTDAGLKHLRGLTQLQMLSLANTHLTDAGVAEFAESVAEVQDHTMTTSSTTAKPRRRWLQFSLRTLLVLMLVCGAGFGWLAHQVDRARAQKRAAVEIEKLWASVEFEDVSGGMIRTAVAWLGKLFGEDLTGNVTRSPCGDAGQRRGADATPGTDATPMAVAIGGNLRRYRFVRVAGTS